MTELLSAFNKHTKSLSPIFQDNKQRFLVAGSEDDPRAATGVPPLSPGGPRS